MRDLRLDVCLVLTCQGCFDSIQPTDKDLVFQETSDESLYAYHRQCMSDDQGEPADVRVVVHGTTPA